MYMLLGFLCAWISPCKIWLHQPIQ